MTNYKFHKNTIGSTLIALLVGSLISVGVIVASLSFYQNYLKTSMNLNQASGFNNQISFILTGIGQELASAGFGINSADSTTKINVKQTASQQDLYWAWFDGQTHCLGIREKHVIDDTTQRISAIVSLLEPSANCETGTPLQNVIWEEAEALFKIKNPNLQTYLTNHQWIFNYTLTDDTCSPFGLNMNTAAQKKKLKIETVSSLVLFGTIPFEDGKFLENFCLYNITV